uniref:Uncharacterized protein n=1 Tax=Aegilops tauschii subsp. strangulata TaxID=200361 RepID=A0A452YCT2_AEGTS
RTAHRHRCLLLISATKSLRLPNISMAERFFSGTSTAAPPFDDAGIILLSGPPCCGKTSLLFQFAINRAAESGRHVVFICSKGRLENSPPFLSQGVEPSLSVLQRIQINSVHSVPADTLKTMRESGSTSLHFTCLTTFLLQSLSMILPVSFRRGAVS